MQIDLQQIKNRSPDYKASCEAAKLMRYRCDHEREKMIVLLPVGASLRDLPSLDWASYANVVKTIDGTVLKSRD